MAETRAQEQKKTEEAIRKLKESDDQLHLSVNQLKEMVALLTMKCEQVLSKSNQTPNPEDGGSSHNPPKSPPPHQNLFPTRYAKIEFPHFAGEDPTGWIYKCERFYEYNQVEEGLKVKLAVMHLDDKALQWFQWYEKTQTSLEWKDFTYGLLVRFGPNVFEDAIGELTKLQQHATVKIYQERFEELANRTTGLSEEFFVSCFISGLKEEIKAGVQMFQPTNIAQAMGLARLQEESAEAIARRSKQGTTGWNHWMATHDHQFDPTKA